MNLLVIRHAIADPRVHRVQCYNRFATVRAVQVQGLHQQDLPALVAGMLLGGNQFADDARDQHQPSPFRGASWEFDPTESVRAARLTWTVSTMPTMVVSVGTSAGRKGKLDSLPRHQ